MVSTVLIDGKKQADELCLQMKEKIKNFSRPPCLAVILVGDNPASLIYIKHKRKYAERLGVSVKFYQLSPVMTEDSLCSFIKELNENPLIDGILVQLPLPFPFDSYKIIDTIDPHKDVDGLSSTNLGYLFVGQPRIIPCTPLACMALLKTVVSDFSGLNAVVIGRSRLVGKPLGQLLLDAGCTLIQAHSQTKNLSEHCKNADIVVSATGHTGLIKKDFIKAGAVVIDVGISRTPEGKIVGDACADELMGIAGAITPVPGGVGPMTVSMIFQNLISICEKNLYNR